MNAIYLVRQDPRAKKSSASYRLNKESLVEILSIDANWNPYFKRLRGFDDLETLFLLHKMLK